MPKYVCKVRHPFDQNLFALSLSNDSIYSASLISRDDFWIPIIIITLNHRNTSDLLHVNVKQYMLLQGGGAGATYDEWMPYPPCGDKERLRQSRYERMANFPWAGEEEKLL